jgi:POT family proton-dependent oligopeptide transporter
VGKLYGEKDHRRDAGFSTYYMGINIGALVAPLILGFMAQDPRFVAFLGRLGLASANGWRWAFGLAGLAMVAGLIQYSLQQHKLGTAGLEAGARETEHGHAAPTEPLTSEEKKRMSVVFILFIFSVLFWATFEQAGSTLNLFADRLTDCSIAGWSFPSTWFQSVNSIWLLILAPILSYLWVKLGSREPSSPIKFAVGLFFVGLGMLLLVPPSKIAAAGVKVGPWWLVGTYLFHTIGELCLSPVGLSTTSKLAPARYAGLMMGVWFASIALGNLLAGFAASLFASLNPAQLFAALFGVTTTATVVLLILAPSIKRLMGETK